MRRPSMIASVLLICLGVILGTTVFRDDIARAAGMAGSAPVLVVNTPAQPVPVIGTVNLGTTGNTHLADIDTQTAGIDEQTEKLTFDADGNLKTTPQGLPPAAGGTCWRRFTVAAGEGAFMDCTDLDASLLFVGGADDEVRITFWDGGVGRMVLFGSGSDGSAQWQLPLSQPLHITGFGVECTNEVQDCGLLVGATGS